MEEQKKKGVIIRESYCSLCKRQFSNKQRLRNHVLNVHERNNLCCLCAKSFTTEPSLKRHVKEVHERQDPVECPECGKKMTERNLKVHLENCVTKVTVQSYEFKCQVSACSSSFMTELKLKKHVAQNHNNNCSECDYKGTTRYKLEKHVKNVHEKDWEFQCAPCSRRFKHVNHLQAHNNHAHPNEQEKIYVCHFDNCNFDTHQPSIMKSHCKEVHEGKMRNYCNKCTYNCWEESTMKLHVSIHHKKDNSLSFDVEKLECSTCGCSFASKTAFANHMKQLHDIVIHGIESEEKVDIEHLGWVMTTHTNRVYEKKKMSKSKKNKSNKGKKYKCGMCKIGFNDPNNRKRHIATVHEGKKPYSCCMCEKAFGQNSHLKRHFSSVHAMTY